MKHCEEMLGLREYTRGVEYLQPKVKISEARTDRPYLFIYDKISEAARLPVYLYNLYFFNSVWVVRILKKILQMRRHILIAIFIF